MNKDQASLLIEALGSKVTSTSDEWVRGLCPLAPYLHKSGKDSHPSFGIRYSDTERSGFHCYSCESGSLAKLLQVFEYNIQQKPGLFHGDFPKAREIVAAEELNIPVLPEYSEFGNQGSKPFKAFPEYFLQTFLPVHMTHSNRPLDYLCQRGFDPEEMVAKWNLRYDTEKDRILFPYRDVFGQLAGIRGRAIHLKGEPLPNYVHHDYPYEGINNSGKVWLNERVLDEPGPIVIVEGQFDMARVAQVYPRVMANLTAKPIPEKMAKIAHATDGVIMMLDGDASGRTGTTKFVEYLEFLGVPVAAILLPFDEDKAIKSDPDSVGTEYIKNELKKIGVDLH